MLTDLKRMIKNILDSSHSQTRKFALKDDFYDKHFSIDCSWHGFIFLPTDFPTKK